MAATWQRSTEVQWTVIPNVKCLKYLIWIRKMFFISISFLQPATNWSIMYDFLAKWSRDISRDLLTQCLYFKMFRTMSSLCVPNFDSAPLSMPKLEPIFHFPQVNALVSGLQLLDASHSISLRQHERTHTFVYSYFKKRL